MTRSILLTGVGGQGTILISKILSEGLAAIGYDVKMSEIHGMSQRGGTVNTQIRFGTRVYAPNIGTGEADLIVAFEKAEALRALPYLKRGGALLMDDREIFPMTVLTGESTYPHDAAAAMAVAGVDVTVLPASEIAAALGNVRAQNICMLGAVIRLLTLEGIDWESLIQKFVPASAVEINIQAFAAGKKVELHREDSGISEL